MTKYEVFLRRGGGWFHVATVQSGSARAAYNSVIESADQLALLHADEDLPGTEGTYMVVPTTNATVIERRRVEKYESNERTLGAVERESTNEPVEEIPA